MTDIVDEVNDRGRRRCVAEGADVVVLLVHEGAPTHQLRHDGRRPGTTSGNIVNGVSADVDAIVSGHTHLAYNCSFPVRLGRAGARPPVVSAGQYGTNLNQLVFTVDSDDRRVLGSDADDPAARGPDPDGSGPLPARYPADPTRRSSPTPSPRRTCSARSARRDRRRRSTAAERSRDGTDVENRGGESTLGNLVAEVQRWATEDDGVRRRARSRS